jgi:hypothetical protein
VNLSSAQSGSAERVGFERRIVDAGATDGAVVVKVFNIRLTDRMEELMLRVAER